MNRLFYRGLIRLHPRAFRERFGDEMLCIFDEASRLGSGRFIADAFASLARQWLFHSGLWRLAVGAGLTALLIVGYAHSEANGQRAAELRYEAQQKPVPPLDQAEFNREAARAVAMLTRLRDSSGKTSHRLHPLHAVSPSDDID
ncbi:MAG TPA: hypothetical protein VMB47_12870 [Candidatus Aquilonibacter sp.]|nr:hypothetical protein [Candidatus Aquilonibacter sp.]